MDRFLFYFQDSCENVAVSTFTPSDNGGKQAFTVTGYTISDYLDEGDDLAFIYDGNYHIYTVVDITGNVLTMSFDYNASITNVNTVLQFSIKVACTPYNFHKGKFEWVKDKDNYFYRLKYSGKVMFKGDDYTYLYNVLNEGCCQVTLKVFKLCDGEYSLYYRSRINKSEGTWNESKCTFETDMIPMDKYNCILERANNEVNIFSMDANVFEFSDMVEDDFIEGNDSGPFWEYLIRAVAPAGAGTTFDIGDGGALFIEINGLAGYASDPNTSNAWVVYIREKRVFVYDYTFGFTSPSLTGYTLTDEVIFNDKITVTYTKQVSYSGITPTLRDAPEISVVLNGFGGCTQFNTYGQIYDPINDNCIIFQRYNITLPDDAVLYPSFNLQGILTLLTNQCYNVNYVTSDFFEINPIGDTVGYITQDNYVTGGLNYVNNLRITNIGFIRNPTINLNPIQNYTFAAMMRNLNYIFNVYWFIDSANRLRIEHDSWFTDNSIVDLSATLNNKYKKEYSYIKEEIPNRERFLFKYAANTDFKGVDIVYDNQCTNSPVIFTRASDWTTDINYVRNADEGNFSFDSLVLLACNSGGDGILYEEGILTGVQMPNGHLSWANLHEYYHTYGRVLEEGQMNLSDHTFDSFKKLRKQNGQKYIECCLTIPENMGTVTTELGIGDATKIVYDINNNTFEFELNI